MTSQRIETVVIGGGQAGPATSFHLAQTRREPVVLEPATGGEDAWQDDRWDSSTLATPNWSFRLPGAEYQGRAPDDPIASAIASRP